MTTEVWAMGRKIGEVDAWQARRMLDDRDTVVLHRVEPSDGGRLIVWTGRSLVLAVECIVASAIPVPARQGQRPTCLPLASVQNAQEGA